jgi:hypothetical protein
VDQVDVRLPEAPVDHDRERVRSLAAGEAKIPKLERLRPVRQPRVCGPWWRIAEDLAAIARGST